MSAPLTISIAMCTYNGERFLEEQLVSFMRQERLPDELVVCDDGSRDATISILQAFATTSPFPIRIYRNPHNLGYGKNFEKASWLCQGNIISFSDQDDVWLPHKLAKIEEIFRSRRDLGYAFSDALIVDENLQFKNCSFWQAAHFTKQTQRKFCHGGFLDLFLKDFVIFGMLLSFRADLRKHIFPLPKDWTHDGWLPIILSLISDFAVIPEPLVLYRQHSYQFCGIKQLTPKEMVDLAKLNNRDHYRKSANMWKSTLERLTAASNDSLLPHKIEDKIKHLNNRGDLPASWLKRLIPVAREAITFRYFRYSNGWKSLAKDLFVA
jgi:glycosyltransferase involved in cell wall biosynthesis